MFNKSLLTQQLLSQFPEQDRLSFDQAMKLWWQDIRNDSGLRLSVSGYDAFVAADIDCHRFEVDKNTLLFPRQLLMLNNKLDCPYYIKPGKPAQLILFGSKQAVLYAIYGDLEKFLAYLQRT